MAHRAHRNQQPLNSDGAIGTSQTMGNTSDNVPDASMNDTLIDLPDQSGGSPRCVSMESDEVNTHVENLETEFKAFRTEFSNFQDNTSNNIQAELDNLHRAHVMMNETLTSRMDENNGLSSKMTELKDLIQNYIVKPSIV